MASRDTAQQDFVVGVNRPLPEMGTVSDSPDHVMRILLEDLFGPEDGRLGSI
jgi:hypothetical protein